MLMVYSIGVTQTDLKVCLDALRFAAFGLVRCRAAGFAGGAATLAARFFSFLRVGVAGRVIERGTVPASGSETVE